MPFVATQIDLKMIMLSEISPKEKDKYDMMSLIWNFKEKIQWIYL